MPWECPECGVRFEYEHEAEASAYFCVECSVDLEDVGIYADDFDDFGQSLSQHSVNQQNAVQQQPSFPFHPHNSQNNYQNSPSTVVPPPPSQQQQIPPNYQSNGSRYFTVQELADLDFYSQSSNNVLQQAQRQNQSQKTPHSPQRFYRPEEEVDPRRSGRKRGRDSGLPDKEAGGRNTKKRMLNRQQSVSYGPQHATEPIAPPPYVNRDRSQSPSPQTMMVASP